MADRRQRTTEFVSVKECPQPASFAGQRPSHLPSPGHRPGSQGDSSPQGPTARPFATSNGWSHHATIARSSLVARRLLDLRLTNDTFGFELPAPTAGPLALLCVWVLGYPARWAGLGKFLGRWPPESILPPAIPQVMNMARWAGTRAVVAETYPELPSERRRP